MTGKKVWVRVWQKSFAPFIIVNLIAEKKSERCRKKKRRQPTQHDTGNIGRDHHIKKCELKTHEIWHGRHFFGRSSSIFISQLSSKSSQSSSFEWIILFIARFFILRAKRPSPPSPKPSQISFMPLIKQKMYIYSQDDMALIHFFFAQHFYLCFALISPAVAWHFLFLFLLLVFFGQHPSSVNRIQMRESRACVD